jgi:hypothetical protein
VAKRGPISEFGRAALHERLDVLIDRRNICERGGKRFRRVSVPRLSVTVALDAYLLHSQAMDFIAQLVGDEVLTQWQPIPTAAIPRSRIKGVQSRLSELLPASKEQLARHRLVALMWEKNALLREKNRKRAKGDVGAAYALSKDAISKWRAPCSRELGSKLLEEALSQVGELEPRHFFPFVFGESAGPKRLSACAKAYHECARAHRGLAKMGRPEKVSA